ncbi:MAG TPA: DUF5985 family protein [Stellaceae bacterium]|nr:DUF5985 family protein [Stellaceae bacterium]
MFQSIVYLLCCLTSFAAMLLLLRNYLLTGSTLLLWSAIAFIALAANNLALFADLVLLPTVNLLWLREISNLVAVCVLLYGFIWEVD